MEFFGGFLVKKEWEGGREGGRKNCKWLNIFIYKYVVIVICLIINSEKYVILEFILNGILCNS